MRVKSSSRIRRRWLAAGIALAAASLGLTITPVAPPANAGGDEAPSKRYRDRNYKFSILNFRSWTQIPVETSSQSGQSDALDDCIVAKFGASKDRGREGGELVLFRMGPKGIPQGARAAGMATTTGDPAAGPTTPATPTPPTTPTSPAPGMDDPGMSDGGMSDPAMGDAKPVDPAMGDPGMGDGAKKPGAKKARSPACMRELLDSLLERFGSRQVLLAAKAKDIRSRDKVPGKLWLIEQRNDEGMPPGANPVPQSMVRTRLHVFAIWEKDGTETGMWAVCDGADRK
jgi:hypothetical protein